MTPVIPYARYPSDIAFFRSIALLIRDNLTLLEDKKEQRSKLDNDLKKDEKQS
jgi:hypothetical protein